MVVPILIEPVTAEIAALIDEVDEVVLLMFLIVLFCRLDTVAVPTDIRIPINVWVVAPVSVQAVPPAKAALPPMKLLLTMKFTPVVSETPITI